LKKPAHVVLFENLSHEMSIRHLSHADIAHRSGMSVNAVKAITASAESGQSFNLDKLDRIAAAFDMTAAQLLSARDAENAAPHRQPTSAAANPTSRRADKLIPKQLARLIEDFYVLPEADRLVLLDTATDMASKYRMHITS
jgi:transcriptional regulator with XRE-family HTH domain